MSETDKEVERVLEKSERRLMLSKFQQVEEMKGNIPHDPSLMIARYGQTLEFAGGAVFGLLTGIMTLYVSYIIFVWLLHLEF